MNIPEALLLDSLEKIRDDVQVPEGRHVGRLVVGRWRYTHETPFDDDLRILAGRERPPSVDIYSAADLAEDVNTRFRPSVEIDVDATLYNPRWVGEHYPRAAEQAGLVSRLYHRAMGAAIAKSETVDVPRVLRQVVIEHLVGRAVTPDILTKTVDAEHTTYFNPYEIAALRAEFTQENLSDPKFLAGLSFTALRKHRTRGFLASMYDTPNLYARVAYATYRELALGATLRPRQKE